MLRTRNYCRISELIIPQANATIVVVFNLFAGSRFRSVIDDYWWSGVVTEVSPYEDHLPDSHFQCFVVRLVYCSKRTGQPVRCFLERKCSVICSISCF